MESKHGSKRRLYLTIIAPIAIIAIIALASFVSGLAISKNSLSTFSANTTTSSMTTSITTINSGSSTETNTITPSSSSSGTSLHTSSSTDPKPPSGPDTGIIVPIYASYSPSEMALVNEVIQVKAEYPSVPVIAVLNQAYGPGHTYNGNVTAEVKSLEDAHVTVLGYVATVYGTRTVNSDEIDIYNWHNWYHAQGIFLDQMPNWEYTGPNGEWNYNGPNGIYIPDYFDNLTAYIHSLGMNIVFGNSGENVPLNLIGTVDSVGIFENSSMPAFFGPESLTGPNSAYLNFNKSKFIAFSYSQTSFDPYYVLSVSNYVSWLFVTNETLPQPYDGLPPYFRQLVSTIASSVSITVNVDLINGTHKTNANVSVSLKQPNGVTSEGYAPFTFNTLSGATVTLTAGNVSGYVFNGWSDGNLNPVRNVTVSQATSLVAYYTPFLGLGFR